MKWTLKKAARTIANKLYPAYHPRYASIAKDDSGTRVIKLVFEDDFWTLERIRYLPGSKYYRTTKCWSVPLRVKTLEHLLKWGFILDEYLRTFYEDHQISPENLDLLPIPGLKGDLYPFQNHGVRFIDDHYGRALVADEMGLGKTIQALAWLQLRKEVRPAIVIVPASVKLNWKRTAMAWMTDVKAEILSGSKPWKTTGNILIINYDVLHGWLDELLSRHPQALILDECHMIKSNTARRTKAVKRLAKAIPHVIALSGTPVMNRPIEIYNAVQIVSPSLFPNYMQYARHYCNARHNGFGWDMSGSSNADELHRVLIENIMVRRLKKDVLKELPAKTHSFVPMEIKNRKEYDFAESDFISFLEKTKGKEAAEKASGAEFLTSIEALKQLAVKGKLDNVFEWIDEFLEVNDKLVVFAIHHFVIDELMKRYADIAVKLDGRITSDLQKQKAVDEFQTNPKIKLFIGNIDSAGKAITLTAASNVAIIEFPWTPSQVDQAADRTHRITQTDPVTIHYLMAMDTIEDKIGKLLDKKRSTINAVLDGRTVDKKTLLTELIKEYQPIKQNV